MVLRRFLEEDKHSVAFQRLRTGPLDVRRLARASNVREEGELGSGASETATPDARLAIARRCASASRLCRSFGSRISGDFRYNVNRGRVE